MFTQFTFTQFTRGFLALLFFGAALAHILWSDRRKIFLKESSPPNSTVLSEENLNSLR